jgi:hypothetical protein
LSASSSSPTHNIYIYGGTFTLRYSYAHDPIQGQNFHIRAKQSTIEYNWFARPKSYSGDLMTDDDFTNGGQQTMLLRGNLIDQGSPNNHGQIIALYNDAAPFANLRLALTLINNTLLVTQPQGFAVHLSNADGTEMRVEMDNNLISGGKPYLIEDAAHGTVVGTSNWLPTGANPGSLTATAFGANPFKDPAARDFTLAAGSNAIGAAAGRLSDAPSREYFQNESVTRMYRTRASSKDIGAFESTTAGGGTGPYAAAPISGNDAGAGAGQKSGCGCAMPGASSHAIVLLIALGFWRLILRRSSA